VSYPVLSGAVVVTAANRRLRFREAAGAVGNVDLALGTYFLRGRYATNLATHSESLDDASWTKSQVLLTPNVVIAPDGTLTADKVVENATSNVHFVSKSVSKTASQITYTASFYARPDGRNFVRAYLFSGTSTNRIDVTVNLLTGAIAYVTSNGTWTLGSCSVTTLENGWYRIAITGLSDTAVAAQLLIATSSGPAAGDSIYLGDGVSGIFVWGAQIEAASSVGPYVRTTTASATGPSNELALAIKNGLDAFGAGGNAYDVSLAADIDPDKQASVLTITRTAGTDTFQLLRDGSQTFDYDLLGFSASTENDSAPKSGGRSAAAVWVGNDVLREREPFGERTVAVPRKANGGVVGVSRSSHMVSWSLGFAFVHEARMLLRSSVDPGGSLESFVRRFGAGAAFQAREVDVASGSTLAPIIEHPFGTLHWSEDTLSAFRPRRIGPGVPLYDLDTTAHEQVT
jgi:hypothetical protein